MYLDPLAKTPCESQIQNQSKSQFDRTISSVIVNYESIWKLSLFLKPFSKTTITTKIF